MGSLEPVPVVQIGGFLQFLLPTSQLEKQSKIKGLGILKKAISKSEIQGRGKIQKHWFINWLGNKIKQKINGGSGKLRAVAVTTATRSEALPDVPTVDDTLPGYEASSLYGIGAPKGAPAQIVRALNTEINAALADPKINVRLADLGGTVVAGQPSEFGERLAQEVAKWAKVIKFAGMKVG